jgi:hypothetical protein
MIVLMNCFREQARYGTQSVYFVMNNDHSLIISIARWRTKKVEFSCLFALAQKVDTENQTS